MEPDKAAAFLMTMIRGMFESQVDLSGPRQFAGTIEWEITDGWDDGYGMWRIVVMPAVSVWSDAYRANVRPVVFVGVGFDSQPHNPHGTRPLVPRFEDQPSGSAPVPLDDLRGTNAGHWVGVIMNHLGGRDPHLYGNGWVGFDVTLPDEAPWVTV